jgi:N-acetylneuraminic acid mutarotase
MPNGKVLVAAGEGNSGHLSSAEQYDPATNLWTSAASITTARYVHTATLLPNGKVLIAGGSGGGYPLNTEQYDSAINTWSAAVSLVVGRYAHTATLLPSGKVLVTGGYNGASLSSTELYDPATPTWSAAASMTAVRDSHTATLLPNGKVLVAAGDTGGAFANAELYDPVANTWSAAGSLTTARYVHTATLLTNGKVLVAGGTSSASILASAELYDPATNTWSAAGNLTTVRYAHTATLLPNGKVLIVGGNNSGGYLASAELYDPATNTWSTATNLTTARFCHTATLLPNGKVLVAGGGNSNGSVTGAELYDPATNTWSAAGNLTTARHLHTATLLPNGKVLVAAGYGGPIASAELYDPTANTWSSAGSLTSARYLHRATLLSNGKVLVAGGQGIGNVYLANAELYDSATNTWSAAGVLVTPRRRPSETLLPNGKVLVAGGQGSGEVYLSSAELFDPGLGYDPSWQPIISTTNSPISTTGSLVLTGSRFKGISESSGGGTNNSASNYPIVQVQSLVNEQTTFLLPTAWSDTSFTSQALSGFPAGYARVTVFTNGIPSAASIILLSSPPAITSPLIASGTVGTAFSYTITASNTPNNFSATGLPAGLTLVAATGIISGTPTTAGSYSVTINALNTVGTGSATLVITVSSPAPVITSALTATGVVGQAFSYTITATGAGSISYAATPLPAGLSLSGGTISGTPTSAGVTNVTLTATNSAGSDAKTLVLTINASGAPLITSSLAVTGSVGTAFSYTITASGNATITFAATGLPAGLTFSTNTISGTPTTQGATSVTLTATNATGSDTKTLQITIQAVGAPSITSAITASAKAGSAFSYTVTATGVPTIVIASGTLPAWLTLSGATLSGTPAAGDVGTAIVSLIATNSLGSDSKTLTITVAPLVSDPPVVTDIVRSRNPVRTNTDVSFTASAVAPSGLTLNYTWYFFTSASVQDGSPLSGKTVTRSFPVEDKYTVIVVAFDGFFKSTNFTKVAVSLAPNSGSDDANATKGKKPVNPNDELGIEVPESKGGVVDFDVKDERAGGGDGSETFSTKVSTFTDGDIDSLKLAGKFSKSGIFVVETTGTTSGGVTRKARMMVPVGSRETGDLTLADNRASKALGEFQIKGKFTFGKSDTLTLNGSVELPAGLALNKAIPVSVGIGNVSADGTSSSKGKVGSMSSSQVKKFQIKYPKVDKATGLSKAGDTAKFSVTMASASLIADGFDTEGITQDAPVKEKLPRKLQVALIIGGVAYYDIVDVVYTVTDKSGQINGRR